MMNDINTSFGLYSSGKLTPSGGVTKLADGTPCKRYIKDAIRLGTYVHPKKGWKLNVTDERLDGWCTRYHAMQANGVPIKLTKNHEDRTKSESVVGDVVGAVREGDWLRFVVEARGQKNIDLIEANKDVSVEIEPELKDGEGNKYGECITAVSIVPNPVVNGQRPFEPIAASLSDDESHPVYMLSNEEVIDMPTILEKIEKVFGLQAGALTEENVDTQLGEIAKKLSLSVEPVKPDTKKLSLESKYGKREIASLDSNKYQPSVRDALTELLIGSEAQQSNVMLSLSTSGEDSFMEFTEKLVKILNSNNPVKTGEATPAQKGILLSREAPDADKSDEKKDKKNKWLND